MAYPESEFDFQDNVLRQKMKQWGIIKSDENIPIQTIVANLLMQSRQRADLVRVQLIPERKEIEHLKKRVQELEQRIGIRRTPTEVDRVYELFKDKLEKEHFGKIVAIDVESKQIVGIGDSILEAYNKAKAKTKKDQFDFRRVGYKYIHLV